MGLIDVADAVAADLSDSGVPVTVYYGPEFKAQDDAAFRVVFVPTGDRFARDRYDAQHHMMGKNPRMIRTRHAGAVVQLWATDTSVQPGAAGKSAADWRALDALINAFILSLHRVSGPNNYELGEGTVVSTATPHVHYGFMYEIPIWVLHPIVDTPWTEVDDVVADITYHLVFPDSDVVLGAH